MQIDTVLYIAIIITILIIAFIFTFNTNDQQQVMTGGKLSETLNSKYFPRVSVLTNYIVQTIPVESFVWLEKTDGLHTIVIIKDNKCYSLVNTDWTYLFDITGKQFVKRSILDCELYNDIYYVFDAAEIEGVDISDKYFKDRMKAAKKFIAGQDMFEIKEFYTVKPWKQLLDFIDNKTSPITGNIIDGVVCQRIDKPYFTTPSDPTVFKMKRKVMNTVDFMIKYVPDSKYFYLYLYGSYKDYIYNHRRLPKENKYMKKHTGVDPSKRLPENLYILFATPYYEDMHIFKPRNRWNRNGYFDNAITEINTLMRKITRNPYDYDGRIIEFSLADDGWVPMRIRSDKDTSNGYRIGLSNLDVIFSPVTCENTYFNKKFAFSDEIINDYHEINRIIRDMTLSTIIDKPIKNVLDLAGGRGGDLNMLIELGANNIFAVDADRDALVQYANRRSKPTSLNVVYAMLGKTNNECINEIQHRYEYPKEGFDLILMNYAIHYLCYDHQCIVALKDLIKRLLKPDGLFVITYFDGDAIQCDMKNKTLTAGPFTIKLCKPQMESSKDAVWANMALPTIDESGYRPEPLVMQSWLDELGMQQVTSFKPVDRFGAKIKESSVNNYLHYITARSFTVLERR